MAVCHVFIHIKMIYFIAEIIEEEAIAPKATGKAIPQVEKSYRDKGQDTSSHFEHVSCGLMKTNKKKWSVGIHHCCAFGGKKGHLLNLHPTVKYSGTIRVRNWCTPPKRWRHNERTLCGNAERKARDRKLMFGRKLVSKMDKTLQELSESLVYKSVERHKCVNFLPRVPASHWTIFPHMDR